MKKKLLTLMVVLVAIFMGTATASAHDFVFEGIYYNILDDTSVEVTLCDTDKEYVGKVDVPSEVIGTDGTTYRVIGIGQEAFASCYELEEVTLPQTLEIIKWDAFLDCPMLNSIVIPASVATIENYAVGHCCGLSSIKVDAKNPVYDSRNNCNAIIETATNTLVAGCLSTNIPTTVEKLGDSSFYGIFWELEEPVEIAIPEGVTELGEEVFGYCTSLAKISLPSTITGIGNNCFLECVGLEEIVCYDETPCVLIDDVFTAVPETAVLRIPAGTKDAYLANGWDSFPGTIVEDDTLTGVESVKAEENAPVEYYNLQGVKVACPENGMYIKKQGGRTSKVVL